MLKHHCCGCMRNQVLKLTPVEFTCLGSMCMAFVFKYFQCSFTSMCTFIYQESRRRCGNYNRNCLPGQGVHLFRWYWSFDETNWRVHWFTDLLIYWFIDLLIYCVMTTRCWKHTFSRHFLNPCRTMRNWHCRSLWYWILPEYIVSCSPATLLISL